MPRVAVGQRDVQADDVRAREQLVERQPFDSVCRSNSASRTVSNATTRIRNARARSGHGAADPTHADQPERHPADWRHQRPVPAAAVDHAVVGDDPPRQRQEQRPGLLGDALLVGPRGDRHGHAVGGRGRDVDQVVADAGARDRPQLGASSKSSGVIRSPPGDQGVDLREVGPKLLGREGEIPLRVDQARSRRRSEDLAKSTGLVAKQIRADQDSRHGHLDEIDG